MFSCRISASLSRVLSLFSLSLKSINVPGVRIKKKEKETKKQTTTNAMH